MAPNLLLILIDNAISINTIQHFNQETWCSDIILLKKDWHGSDSVQLPTIRWGYWFLKATTTSLTTEHRDAAAWSVKILREVWANLFFSPIPAFKCDKLGNISIYSNVISSQSHCKG